MLRYTVEDVKYWSSHTIKTFLDVNISSLLICDIFRYHFLAANRDRLEFINIARLISFSRKRHDSQLLPSAFRLLIQLKSLLWCYLTKRTFKRKNYKCGSLLFTSRRSVVDWIYIQYSEIERKTAIAEWVGFVADYPLKEPSTKHFIVYKQQSVFKFPSCCARSLSSWPSCIINIQGCHCVIVSNFLPNITCSIRMISLENFPNFSRRTQSVNFFPQENQSEKTLVVYI